MHSRKWKINERTIRVSRELLLWGSIGRSQVRDRCSSIKRLRNTDRSGKAISLGESRLAGGTRARSDRFFPLRPLGPLLDTKMHVISLKLMLNASTAAILIGCRMIITRDERPPLDPRRINHLSLLTWRARAIESPATIPRYSFTSY